MRGGLKFAVRFSVTVLIAAIVDLAAITLTGQQPGFERLNGAPYFVDLSAFAIDTPLLALAQTIPPFLAAVLVRRFGFLVGALVGGVHLISGATQIASLLVDGKPLQVIGSFDELDNLTAGLARAMIGAFAGAAGQLMGERLRRYWASRRGAQAVRG
jgi:hypothetical protein